MTIPKNIAHALGELVADIASGDVTEPIHLARRIDELDKTAWKAVINGIPDSVLTDLCYTKESTECLPGKDL